MIKINVNDYVCKNNLRIYRLQRSISQGELAKVLGVSRNTISSIENKDVDVTLVLAIKICRFFGCPFGHMFRLEKKNEQTN